MPRIVVSSQFFLDAQRWAVVRDEVLPAIAGSTASPRFWSAGCHVGKEPFSMAVLLDEAGLLDAAHLLATDKDAALLSRAAAGGPFSTADVELLSPAQRSRYLQPGGPPYWIVPRLCSAVTFRQHDLRHPPPEAGFDLVLFRDVQPFFLPGEHRSVVERLYRALRPGGWLFLGATDTVPGWRDIGFDRNAPGFLRRPEA